MLVPFLATGILHQDAANGLGRGGEEMAAMVPVIAVGCPNQPEVGFVNESGWLQGLARLLGRQLGGGELAQFIVNEREQVGGGLPIASLYGGQDGRYLIHRRNHSGLHGVFGHFTTSRNH